MLKRKRMLFRFKKCDRKSYADALYDVLYNINKYFNVEKKMVAQSYNGALVMAEQLCGLQAKLRETFPSASLVLSQINLKNRKYRCCRLTSPKYVGAFTFLR